MTNGPLSDGAEAGEEVATSRATGDRPDGPATHPATNVGPTPRWSGDMTTAMGGKSLTYGSGTGGESGRPRTIMLPVTRIGPNVSSTLNGDEHRIDETGEEVATSRAAGDRPGGPATHPATDAGPTHRWSGDVTTAMGGKSLAHGNGTGEESGRLRTATLPTTGIGPNVSSTLNGDRRRIDGM